MLYWLPDVVKTQGSSEQALKSKITAKQHFIKNSKKKLSLHFNIYVGV